MLMRMQRLGTRRSSTPAPFSLYYKPGMLRLSSLPLFPLSYEDVKRTPDGRPKFSTDAALGGGWIDGGERPRWQEGGRRDGPGSYGFFPGLGARLLGRWDYYDLIPRCASGHSDASIYIIQCR